MKDQVQDSWSGNVLRSFLLLAHLCVISKRSYSAFLSTVIHGHPSTAPPSHPYEVTSCLEISLAKGYGSLPISGLAPYGPGTKVTQLTGPTPLSLVCTHSHWKAPVMFCGTQAEWGPSHPSSNLSPGPGYLGVPLYNVEFISIHRVRSPTLLHTKPSEEALNGRCDHLRVKIYFSPDLSQPID